jgi:hypothetical protein
MKNRGRNIFDYVWILISIKNRVKLEFQGGLEETLGGRREKFQKFK